MSGGLDIQVPTSRSMHGNGSPVAYTVNFIFKKTQKSARKGYSVSKTTVTKVLKCTFFIDFSVNRNILSTQIFNHVVFFFMFNELLYLIFVLK